MYIKFFHIYIDTFIISISVTVLIAGPFTFYLSIPTEVTKKG